MMEFKSDSSWMTKNQRLENTEPRWKVEKQQNVAIK